jgi:hypothetical protein
VRDRIGQHEDRFFATVFLGSGFLFVAMLFVASAVTAALLAATGARPRAAEDVSGFGRSIGALVLHVYAMGMAAVFTISTATIGLRTGFLPRWLAFWGHGTALVLLLAVSVTPWVELLFPLWISSSASTPLPRVSGDARRPGARRDAAGTVPAPATGRRCGRPSARVDRDRGRDSGASRSNRHLGLDGICGGEDNATPRRGMRIE